jgi:hypothetical protein
MKRPHSEERVPHDQSLLMLSVSQAANDASKSNLIARIDGELLTIVNGSVDESMLRVDQLRNQERRRPMNNSNTEEKPAAMNIRRLVETPWINKSSPVILNFRQCDTTTKFGEFIRD